MTKKILVLGGGAAGFFSAITSARVNTDSKVTIIEKLPEVLTKVKISGGGRCNVTNIISDPGELIKYYPRGGKQLLNLFYQFGTRETIEWFKNCGIELKVEEDGRVFPVSDNSQTIIDCLTGEAKKLHIEVLTGVNAQNIIKCEEGWEVITNNKKFLVDSLIITTGSSKRIWENLSSLGHTVVEPVPSLFTFNINKEKDITELAGISVKDAEVSIKEIKQSSRGSLLITHWGFSGPAILKLSAFGARELNKIHYEFSMNINWMPDMNQDTIKQNLLKTKKEYSSKSISTISPLQLPRRLWEKILSFCNIEPGKKWNDVSSLEMNKIVSEIHEGAFLISGKSTFKEEFVTAGGVDLNEINLKTMESKLHKGLYFAGEVLNIDGVTGGFNFQAAWSTGYIAGSSQI